MNDFSELSVSPSESRRPVVVTRSSPFAWLLLLVAIGLGAFCAYSLQQQLEGARGEVEAARKAASDVALNLHQTEEAKRALEGQVAKLEAVDQGLRDERDSLNQSVQQKESELAQLKGTYRTLEEKLQAEIKKGDVHLTEANGKIRVDLVDQILFESGQAGLSGRGAEVLSRVGGVLASVQGRQIQVSGHTDDSPISDKLRATYPTNWELSVMRAVNVVRHLTEHGGVPAKRLLAAGYGPYEPIASNGTPQGRARNRRIEIILMPPLSAKPSAALPPRKGSSRVAAANVRHSKGR